MVRRYTKKRSVKSIYLFCEGEKTERFYFEQLRQELRGFGFIVKVKKTNKTDPLGLMREALSFKKHEGEGFFDCDELYCVLDCDSHSDEILGKARKFAEENSINLIFSNPSFEYWILAHFEKVNNVCDNSQITSKLRKHLGDYEKNDINIFKKINDKIETAISNAKSVNASKEDFEIFSRNSNPFTNVFEFIEYLKNHSN